MNTTIANFWNHFKENNFVFRLIFDLPKEEMEKHLKELNNLLYEYNEDLGVIIKNGKEEGLNIRKIQEIRTDISDPVIGLKTPPTKGLSGKTKFHKK